MRSKMLAIGAAVSGVVGSVLATLVAHAQMTTTTLASSIDSVNGTTYDYFLVLLAKYWPFVVGFGVLLIAWGFGRRILQHFA